MLFAFSITLGPCSGQLTSVSDVCSAISAWPLLMSLEPTVAIAKPRSAMMQVRSERTKMLRVLRSRCARTGLKRSETGEPHETG